jgi:hypothetical protein
MLAASAFDVRQITPVTLRMEVMDGSCKSLRIFHQTASGLRWDALWARAFRVTDRGFIIGLPLNRRLQTQPHLHQLSCLRAVDMKEHIGRPGLEANGSASTAQ